MRELQQRNKTQTKNTREGKRAQKGKLHHWCTFHKPKVHHWCTCQMVRLGPFGTTWQGPPEPKGTPKWEGGELGTAPKWEGGELGTAPERPTRSLLAKRNDLNSVKTSRKVSFVSTLPCGSNEPDKHMLSDIQYRSASLCLQCRHIARLFTHMQSASRTQIQRSACMHLQKVVNA